MSNLPSTERPRNCPTCDSPHPELHPAVQSEGEVQLCRNEWHNFGEGKKYFAAASPRWPGCNPNIPRNCKACGEILLLENLYVDDGCPCNSARGVNFNPQPCELCKLDCCVKPGHRLYELFGIENPAPAVAPSCEPPSQFESDLQDAVMLLRMVLTRKDVTTLNCLKPKIADWLKRKGYEGSILREEK